MALENNQIANSNIDNDEISLKEVILKIKIWITFLKSKWKLIFLVATIGGLIGLTFGLFEKPTYKAVLTFAMEDDKGGGGGGLGGALGLASSFGIDLGGGGGGAFAATNITELMKSHLLIEKVLLNPILVNGKIISMADYYIKINELNKKWDKSTLLRNIVFLPNLKRFDYTLQQDSILKIIYKEIFENENVSIYQKDKKVSILTIEVKSKDEIFSKFFSEYLAKETSNFYIETKSKKARINVEVLQRQVDSVKNSLNFAINGVATEVDNVYNMNPALNIKAAPSKKRQIDVQANTAILTNLAVQLELAKITLRKETPLIQLIDRPTLPLEKIKFGKLKSIILGTLSSGILFIFYLIFSNLYRKMMI